MLICYRLGETNAHITDIAAIRNARNALSNSYGRD